MKAKAAIGGHFLWLVKSWRPQYSHVHLLLCTSTLFIFPKNWLLQVFWDIWPYFVLKQIYVLFVSTIKGIKWPFAQSVKLSNTTILRSLLPFHRKSVNLLYCARSSDTGTFCERGPIFQRMLTVSHKLPQALTTCLQYGNKLNNHMLNHKMLVTLCWESAAVLVLFAP